MRIWGGFLDLLGSRDSATSSGFCIAAWPAGEAILVKLLAAVWAGEAQRSADDVRSLQGPDKTDLLHALGVADAWATGVQDG